MKRKINKLGKSKGREYYLAVFDTDDGQRQLHAKMKPLQREGDLLEKAQRVLKNPKIKVVFKSCASAYRKAKDNEKV